MTNKELQEILTTLPDDANIFTGDDRLRHVRKVKVTTDNCIDFDSQWYPLTKDEFQGVRGILL